jgi:hypothetical protein
LLLHNRSKTINGKSLDGIRSFFCGWYDIIVSSTQNEVLVSEKISACVINGIILTFKICNHEFRKNLTFGNDKLMKAAAFG